MSELKHHSEKAIKETGISIDVKPRKNLKSQIELVKRRISKIHKSSIPECLSPMLATLTTEPFNNEDWIFEIKWDGYRAIAYNNNGSVDLKSRENQNYVKDYPPVVSAIKDWNINVVVDGEIVVLDEEGKPDFNGLQGWKRHRDESVIFYYVFDLLWLDGYDLRELPLIERKNLLKQIVPENSLIKYSDYIEEHGRELFQTVASHGYEGIVAKRKQGLYWCGRRTRDWLKLPVVFTQMFVVAGWVESDVAGKPFKTLLFGYYDKGKLIYYHHSGSGWKDREMRNMLIALRSAEVSKNPFANEVDYEGVKHWMKPRVAEFKISKITKEGEIRHPAVFQGWSSDIQPKKITRETIEWLKNKN
jgi:bifunctional non-homologous end joining protein LigD